MLQVHLNVDKDVEAGHAGDVHGDQAGVPVVHQQICGKRIAAASHINNYAISPLRHAVHAAVRLLHACRCLAQYARELVATRHVQGVLQCSCVLQVLHVLQYGHG